MAYQITVLTERAIEFTRQITTRWTARLTGSEACLACGEAIRQELDTFCDNTQTQDFSVRPESFLGFIKINVVLYFLILGNLWFQHYVIAAVFAVLSISVTVFQFFLYKEFTDFLYPQKKAKNVFGTIEPSGEVKQQIIVTAHHDSAFVLTFLQHWPKYYVLVINTGLGISFGLILFSIVAGVAELLGGNVSSLVGIGCWIFLVASIMVIPLWFFHKNEGTPGAGDNMICTAVAIEIGRYFAQQKAEEKGLTHTRLIIGSWDSEEAGLRGARAFVKAHQSDLLQTKTYNYNLECLYSRNAMALLTSDLNSFVKLSEPMANECANIGNQLGYTVGTMKFPLLAGGTDAAEFAKAGIEATTFIAMNAATLGDNPAYHTLRDTVDAIDTEAVAASIEIGIHYILGKDRSI